MINKKIMGLAQLIKNHLHINREKIDLPFIYDFPKNSCEIASIVLGLSIIRVCQKSNLYIISGYCKNSDEYHYWLESDDLIIDITCSQFLNIEDVCFSPETYPLSKKYNNIEKVIFKNYINSNDLYLLNIDAINKVIINAIHT
jgi:hypothetical protein